MSALRIIQFAAVLVIALRLSKHVTDCVLRFCLQLMSSKKDVKKSPLIETTTTGDNNQSLKPLKRFQVLTLSPPTAQTLFQYFQCEFSDVT